MNGIVYVFGILCDHRFISHILRDPSFQRHIIILRRRKPVPPGRSYSTQQLSPNGIRICHVFFNRHVVPELQPAIAVSVEQRLPCPIGSVRAPTVPDPPVEEDGTASWDLNVNRTFWEVFTLGLPNFVESMAARHRTEIPGPDFGTVGQEVRALD